MIPVYISGKGMHASEPTWSFKTSLMLHLLHKRLAVDTRFAYYRRLFPELDDATLARRVCDPMEYYDPDWPQYLREHEGDEALLATQFMWQRDESFQRQARAAIYCFDEAGFGSGINVMRFVQAGKPVLGFYNPAQLAPTVNLSNILQLGLSNGNLVTLCPYENTDEIRAMAEQFIEGL